MRRLAHKSCAWIQRGFHTRELQALQAPAAAAVLILPQLQQAASSTPLPSIEWSSRSLSHFSTSTSAVNGGGATTMGNAAAAHEQQRRCFSCQEPLQRGALTCTACNAIQPEDPSLTYYELLGYDEPTFDLDPSELEKRYKQLQWQLHPDKAAQRPAAEREHSADHASLLNQAYSALRSPLARANYLLTLAGVSAGDSHEGTIEDPELLIEVMEAREEVEATDDKQHLAQLQTSNKQRQAALEQRLSRDFADGDLQAAAALTTELTYLVRLEQAIVHKL